MEEFNVPTDKVDFSGHCEKLMPYSASSVLFNGVCYITQLSYITMPWWAFCPKTWSIFTFGQTSSISFLFFFHILSLSYLTLAICHHTGKLTRTWTLKTSILLTFSSCCTFDYNVT